MISRSGLSLTATVFLSGIFFNSNAFADVAAAVLGEAGSLGVGGALAMGTNDLSVRVGISRGQINQSGEKKEASLDENLKMNFGGTKAIVDWYPFAGSFRVSGGLVDNVTQFDVGGSLSSDKPIKLNGNEYSADKVSGYNAEISFKKTVPYVGVGWGNPVTSNDRIIFMSDFGLLLQDSPQMNASVTCIADAATCANIDADLAAEIKDVESNNWKIFNYYFSLGLAFRFL